MKKVTLQEVATSLGISRTTVWKVFSGHEGVSDSLKSRIIAKAQELGYEFPEDFPLDPLPEDAPFFVKDYYDYYKTERGYHRRSPNSNEGITKTSVLSFINMPLLTYISEIRSAVLMIHGEKAHSRYFSEDAYKRLTGSNKELLIIPGANHVDLYDKIDVIPFDKIDGFFKNALK